MIYKSVLLEDCTIVYVSYKEMTLKSIRTKTKYPVGVLLVALVDQRITTDVSAFNTQKFPCIMY